MKKVLITGGNGDIASAIISQLNSIGGYEIMAPGKEVMDVTDPKSVRDFVDSFIPDILVNNAGYVVPMSIISCDIFSEKKAIDINLFGVFNCTAAVLAKNRNAQIINIGSSAATKSHGTWSSYCAAKACVVMATQCWADDGVNTVCLSPGRTATKMRKGLFPEEDTNTLLRSEDFAKIVIKAINGYYKKGSHINVTKQNVEELING
jgi:NAD(P)-dependent dehydrogenase (short-subunit alcohol dehydrogenase family)